MKQKKFLKKYTAFIILPALLLFAAVLAVRIGSAALSFKEFLYGLFRMSGYETQTIIIYSVRLPRVLAAVLAGIGLSISGVLLQSVTGNELAGPNIIGVNSGAGLAIILQLFFAPNAIAITPFAAFAGAFTATLLIIVISMRVKGGQSTVILAGIAVTTLLNAGISFISLLDTDILAAYNYFSVGGLSGVTPGKLPIPAVIITLSASFAMILSRKINTLCLGDEISASLGIRVNLLRLVSLALASASAAAVVSFAGLLGFIGLIVPHIARRLYGASLGILIPSAAMIGAILAVTADLLGRIIISPSEIPVGIIMACIGAPFFFYLLMKGDKRDKI